MFLPKKYYPFFRKLLKHAHKGASKNPLWRVKCAAMKWRNRSVAVLREDCAEASLQASLPPEWIFRGSYK